MLTLRAIRKPTNAGDRIELVLNGPGIAPQLQAAPIFFEVEGSDLTELAVLDGFIGGVLHYLMENQHDLHVEGRLSGSTLRNLSDYQQFWSLLHASRCTPVRISADEIVADRGNDRGLPAVVNFSGGIDSTFTVVRHGLRLCGTETIPPAAALIVHGFDVPLADEAGFRRLLDRLQPILEEVGLPRYVVRTNLKEMALQNWLDSYPAQLVSCLHAVSHLHSTALVASDGYAQSPSFEFGGNPISVPLLSTSRLRVLYDGGQTGRTEKVAQLARYPRVRRSLKFCWQGPDPDRNCGRCPKCLLTYLNFRAVGIEAPECFDVPVSDDAVGTFTIRNRSSLPLGYEVLEHLWKSPSLAGLADRFHSSILRFEEENGLQPPARPAPGPRDIVFPVCHPVPHDAMAALNGGTVRRAPDFTIVEADPRDWAYSAIIHSDHFAGMTGPGRIEVRLHAEEGAVGVLVLNRGSLQNLVVPEQCAGSWLREPVTLRFEIPDMADVGDLVFRRWPGGGHSRARIFEIKAMCNQSPAG